MIAPRIAPLILGALHNSTIKWVTEEVSSADSFARSLESTRYDLRHHEERRLAWSDGLRVGHILRERFPVARNSCSPGTNAWKQAP